MRILALGLVALAGCKTLPPIPPPRFLSPPLVAWSEDHDLYEHGSGHYSTEIEVFTEGGRGEVRVRIAVKSRGEEGSAHLWIVALEADEVGRLEGSLNAVKLMAGAPPPKNDGELGQVAWTLCVRGGDVVTCETRHASDWRADPASTALFEVLTELQRRARDTGLHFEEF